MGHHVQLMIVLLTVSKDGLLLEEHVSAEEARVDVLGVGAQGDLQPDGLAALRDDGARRRPGAVAAHQLLRVVAEDLVYLQPILQTLGAPADAGLNLSS